ncbi:MAG: glucuronyl hydrolase [Spirochaetaceae bacterium]|nr:MAG: glucuronyl hydrolase [Spirochaetaceae bacterium]
MVHARRFCTFRLLSPFPKRISISRRLQSRYVQKYAVSFMAQVSSTAHTHANMKTLELARRLYDHYESVEQVKHYYGLLAIHALVQVAEQGGESLDRCRWILSLFPERIDHPQAIGPMYGYNFPSYYIGGIPAAYAYFRGHMPEKEEQVHRYAEEMMSAPRDPSGIMKDPRAPEDNRIWIDVAMAVTPYLLFAGLALENQDYVDEAVKQTIMMYDLLRNPNNGLLHQSRNFNGPGRFSDDHWGRGNGWGYFALTELIRYLPNDSPHRTAVEKYFIDHSEALLPHQSRRGMWRQEIPLDLSYEETSGTGLILYGFGAGLRAGLLDEARFRPSFEQGVSGLVKVAVNPDFSINNSCPGCLCPGEGEEKGSIGAYVTLKLPHRDEHHGFAPIMYALLEAHRHGITEVGN